MANRLAHETSRYLLQHSDNPVDWYPWSDDALRRAREEDKPILLSIGYSACHWCHVMERESYEDEQTAAFMNDNYVCVKVDREERPDIDAIYMDACQAMTGRGGWPLNVFLTPDQIPFYAGTYFPPEPRQGLPSWSQVLQAVAEAWRDRRDQIQAHEGAIVERLRSSATLEPADEMFEPRALEDAVKRLAGTYDPINGGFGDAPKFPPSSVIEFLLRRGDTEMAPYTLRRMAAGGIYDQIGGGFHRYAVDPRWAIPHFEKMLYDNALLARAYLHGWQTTGEELFLAVCCETLEFLLREMRAPEGGFYSTLDAESEGIEGKYYVWTIDELRETLGPDADTAIKYFGVTASGNLDGANVLVRARSQAPNEMLGIKRRLNEARARRVALGRDEKQITSWNALTISALAEAGAVLERSDFLDAAAGCAEFVLRELRDHDGRLVRTYQDGQARLAAYLEDYAFLVESLLTLYEASFDPRWFRAARDLADVMIERFADERRGGFFETASDHEPLVARPKELFDHPMPSGNSSAAYGLLRLAALTAEPHYEHQAVSVFRLVSDRAFTHPVSFAHLLQAADFFFADVREIALAGNNTKPLERVVRSVFRPHIVLAGGEADAVPLLQGRGPVDGRPVAYVCERFACRQPVADPDELERLLAA